VTTNNPKNAARHKVTIELEPGAKPINFPIVGMGASAGGLEAIEQFLQNTPPTTGLAFVLIQHLDPSHSSLLSEILQRSTAMPVV
jgi:two-component system CheB/CheR fusion protein